MKAKMNNYNIWIKNQDIEVLKQKIEKDLIESGFNVLEKCEHYFKVHGYTGLWLLSESHLAVHTFPEENTIYLELSSCIDEPFENMVQKIKRY